MLPNKEVSRLLDLRQKVYHLEGPPGGDACPIPAEAAMGNGDDIVELTRSELVQLISDAIREVGGR